MTIIIQFKREKPDSAQIETILGLPAGSVSVTMHVPSYEVTITLPDGTNPDATQRQALRTYLKECLAYDRFVTVT